MASSRITRTQQNSATLARTARRVEFTDRWNPLRIVSKPASVFVWARPADAAGRIRIALPQTGLTAWVDAAALRA